MKRHALRFLGGHADDLRVPAQALVEAVGALLEGAERALRLVVEGESVRSGARPAWLDAACRIEVTGLASGSAVIAVEAPTLAEAVPDRFGPDRQASLFGEPRTRLDSTRTAVDLFGDVLAAVVSGDREGLRADRSLLDSCIRFARAAGGSYGGIQLEGLAGRSEPVTVRRDLARTTEHLLGRDAGPSRGAGLRCPGYDVRVEDGRVRRDRRWRGRGGSSPTAGPRCAASQVRDNGVISGVAQRRPSGRLSVRDVA
jgi:hypothetical protein